MDLDQIRGNMILMIHDMHEYYIYLSVELAAGPTYVCVHILKIIQVASVHYVQVHACS